MGLIDELDVGMSRFADKMEIYGKRVESRRVASIIKLNAKYEATRRAGEPVRPGRCPYCKRDLASPVDEKCLFCGKEWNREPKAEEPRATSSNGYRKAEEPKANSSNSYREPKAEEPKATSRPTSPLSSDEARLLLGLGRTFSAGELKTAWKRKVSEWHPDKLDGMADELRTLATQRVQRLNEAYTLLRT